MCAKITVYGEKILNFLYVCEKYGISGENFGVSGKILVCLPKLRLYYGKFFDMSGNNFLVTSPPLAKNFGEKY